MLVAPVFHDLIVMSDVHRIVSRIYHTLLTMFSLSSIPHYVLTGSISLILMGCIQKFFVLIASVVHDQVVMSDVHMIVSGLYHTLLTMFTLACLPSIITY